jgi:hypothetical protein
MTTEQTSAVPSIDWRSIIAGAVAAAALAIVLVGFGSAVGLSLTSARPYAGLAASSLAVLSALWIGLVYVATFAAGGYIAGRMRVPASAVPKEREFRDGAHGFLVWALGTLVGTYLLASTLTAVASKTVDSAARAAEAAGQATTAAATSAGITELVSYNVDRVFRTNTPGAAPAAPNPNAARDTAEIVRIFAISLANGSLSPADKDYITGMAAARAGIPAADASRRVDEAFNAVSAKKAELESKARNAAETARKAGVISAFLAAAVAMCGLVAAIWAASSGGRDRDEGRDLVVFGQARLW